MRLKSSRREEFLPLMGSSLMSTTKEFFTGANNLYAEGTRPSGVETVRSEMLVGIEPERQSVGWYYADDLLARAADLYGVHSASLAEHYKSDPIPWSELSDPTVRAWVAVARAPRY